MISNYPVTTHRPTVTARAQRSLVVPGLHTRKRNECVAATQQPQLSGWTGILMLSQGNATRYFRILAIDAANAHAANL